ncbi:MAG TPA: ribosomal protein S18-alanine N-acetyltransferase [Corynebacterium sp.]|nr:ribosomal protein S18-alanine N-acetyltransferase [Corynebacterium sp.]
MILRHLTRADATRCAELEQLLFPDDGPWPRDAFVVEIAAPYTVYLGVEEDGELIGYAGMAVLGPPEDPEFEIRTVGVDPAHRRRGVARMLLEPLVRAADERDSQMFLEVRTDNEAALTLYESYGFTRLAVRRKYYPVSGADAYTMIRKSRSER